LCLLQVRLAAPSLPSLLPSLPPSIYVLKCFPHLPPPPSLPPSLPQETRFNASLHFTLASRQRIWSNLSHLSLLLSLPPFLPPSLPPSPRSPVSTLLFTSRSPRAS
jgi:hypothetical protein